MHLVSSEVSRLAYGRLIASAVVESSAKRKKSKGGMNVFQFAETVEEDAWEDEKQKQDLQVSSMRYVRA